MATKSTVDDFLTKAQTTAAKKQIATALAGSLEREIGAMADKVARKFIKDNKVEIETELKKRYEKLLKGSFDAIAKDALKRTSVYITDNF